MKGQCFLQMFFQNREEQETKKHHSRYFYKHRKVKYEIVSLDFDLTEGQAEYVFRVMLEELKKDSTGWSIFDRLYSDNCLKFEAVALTAYNKEWIIEFAQDPYLIGWS